MVDATHFESLIDKHNIPIKSNAKRDKNNIFLLLVLYTLQGLPLGFSLAIPILMQNIDASYSEQVSKIKPYVFKIRFILKTLRR